MRNRPWKVELARWKLRLFFCNLLDACTIPAILGPSCRDRGSMSAFINKAGDGISGTVGNTAGKASSTVME